MDAPDLEFVCELNVALGDVREMGDGRAGTRRIIAIVGGTVTGPEINGRILNLGADWQTIFADGLAELDTRYGIETNDGATIEVVNYGYRHGPPEMLAALAAGEDVDPATYYMRTHARLESGDPRYAWVNRTLFVGTGVRRKASVVIGLYAIR